MSKVRVTHKYPRKTSSNVETVFLFTLLVGGAFFLNFLNIGFEGTPFYIMVGVGLLLTFILVNTDFSRRRKSQLFAEFDPEGTNLHVWMKKGNSMWKGRLSILGNSMDLRNVEKVNIEVINSNRTLVLTEKESSSRMFIPQRIAVQPELQNFVLNVIDKNKDMLSQNTVIVMTSFFKGETGVIDKLSKKEKEENPKTISELLEAEENKQS